MQSNSAFKIAPSLLAADFLHLADAVQLVNDSDADWLHLDVMDGRFVPNISFGVPVIRDVGKLCKKPMDVHLMIVEPEKYIQTFRDAGADVITVHYEACPNLHRTIQQIKESGAMAGVAINPHTPPQALTEVLEDLDMVLVMSVNPGFGGQKFIYRSLDKVRQIRRMMTERNISAHIEVDGGVGLENAQAILEAGATVLVAGSSVYKAENPTEVIDKMRTAGTQTLRV